MDSKHRSCRRRGISLMYLVVAMAALFMFASLSVDVGRVQAAKTELRRTADASARYAASGLSQGVSEVRKRAKASVAENTSDGTSLSLKNGDIEFVAWNTSSKTYRVLSGSERSDANAVRVTVARREADGTAVPLTFASILGRSTFDIDASAVAMYLPGVNVDQNVPATANPFLAGMPAGSIASRNNPHNSPDYAGSSYNPKQSPLKVNIPVDGAMTFDSITGDARHDPSLADYSPDGQLDSIGTNTAGDENGLKGVKAPINALVGVYLDDSAPNTSPVPSFTQADLQKCPTDFSTADSRNQTSYAPKLKQMFFIGDGKTDDGRTQEFVPPPGATRLYLATWDFYEWNNNAGTRNVKVHRPAQVKLVQ